MDTEIRDVVTEWGTRPVADGVAGLYELVDAEFSGAVTDGTAWAYVLNGRFVGLFDGDVEDFEEASLTAYVAPDRSLPLLFAMQEGDHEVRGEYYSNETSLQEIDETLSAGNFVGYVELSENVLSGDYYVVYYAGRSLPVAYVGNSRRLLAGDEAFERAADEVGIYSVVTADVSVVDLPERPEPEPAPEPTDTDVTVAPAAGGAEESAVGGAEESAVGGAEVSAAEVDGEPAIDGTGEVPVGTDEQTAVEVGEESTVDEDGESAVEADGPTSADRDGDAAAAEPPSAVGFDGERTDAGSGEPTADASPKGTSSGESMEWASTTEPSEEPTDDEPRETTTAATAETSEAARLRERIAELEAEISRLESDAPADAERTLSPEEALAETHLFVRYEDRAAGTLDDAMAGRIEAEALRANLRLDHHTQFETAGTRIEGDTVETFLHGTPEYRLAEWLLTDLLFEIRRTDAAGLSKLYEALDGVDRIDFDGEVDVGTDAAQFDVVFRDKMGDPLFVASLETSRDPTRAGSIRSLVDGARSVSETTPSLAAAFFVTTSFYDADAMEVAIDATRGGLFSRSSRSSYVKLSRKSGFHLCLVEARDGEFYLTEPEL